MADISKVLQDHLTKNQLAAATDQSPEVLTLACAGSGKSRTLAFRIAHLVASGNRPSGIVAFTFTEKAAESIKRNVAKALKASGVEPAVLGAMYIGTIHSYCQHVLGILDAKYRQYDVLDGNRLVLYLMSRYGQLGLHALRNEKGAAYFDTLSKVADAWSTMNDEAVSPSDVSEYDETLGGVLESLKDSLEHDQFIDFSLMIRLVVDALESGNERALSACESLSHLMVDEYQDINTLQERLIRLLHQNSDSLFVVGDDDQSIYGWRGADVNNILTFEDRYPKASRHTLSVNFRSCRAIVETAESFVASELGANRIAKNPSANEDASPRDYRVLWFSGRQDEADWVAERIASLLGAKCVEVTSDGPIERGLTPSDFAILMRSTRSQEQDGSPRHQAFSDALSSRGIAVSLEAGGSPFDVPHVEVLRSTFSLLRNSTPTREELREHFDSHIAPVYSEADFNSTARVMSEWGRKIHAPAGGVRQRIFPQNLVHELLEAFGVSGADLEPYVMSALGLFSGMIQDVESVYVSIDSADRFHAVLNFLSNVADRGYNLSTDDLVQVPDAVTVSTVHKMKGLEYPVVFVVDVEHLRFPPSNRRYSGWLPEDVISDALGRGCYASNPDEEARLFFTSLTRAERFLYVSGSENLPGAKGKKKRSKYSLALRDDEISDETQGLPDGLESANPIPRLADSSLPTSYSEIRYYLKCPRDYQYRYRYGFTPAIVEMFGFGQTIHTAIGKLHEAYTDAAPTGDQARALAESVFHLKHVPPSGDPERRPGGYENARAAAGRLATHYAESYADDFTHRREVEARFEIPLERAVISGSIDLLVKEDEDGQIVDANVIDFKAMEGGADPLGNEELDWTSLALQVQLYAKAASEVLGDAAKTGAVHLLKDNQRVSIPVSSEAVSYAVKNVEWAVKNILAGDFPMRPSENKCSSCDFKRLCARVKEDFADDDMPPSISLPNDEARMVRAFSDVEE